MFIIVINIFVQNFLLFTYVITQKKIYCEFYIPVWCFLSSNCNLKFEYMYFPHYLELFILRRSILSQNIYGERRVTGERLRQRIITFPIGKEYSLEVIIFYKTRISVTQICSATLKCIKIANSLISRRRRWGNINRVIFVKRLKINECASVLLCVVFHFLKFLYVKPGHCNFFGFDYIWKLLRQPLNDSNWFC